jgi:hypothetical protein
VGSTRSLPLQSLIVTKRFARRTLTEKAGTIAGLFHFLGIVPQGSTDWMARSDQSMSPADMLRVLCRTRLISISRACTT